MATPAQIEANRLNALKSTGPRTVEGKARAALNALTHGLTSLRIAAADESAEAYEQLRQRLGRELAPRCVLEAMLVEQIAQTIWRLGRVANLESAVLDEHIEKIACLQNDKTAGVQKALLRDFTLRNSTLMKVQVYQNRLERALHRALAELRLMKKQAVEEIEEDERSADVVEADAPPAPPPPVDAESQNDSTHEPSPGLPRGGRNQTATPGAQGNAEHREDAKDAETDAEKETGSALSASSASSPPPRCLSDEAGNAAAGFQPGTKALEPSIPVAPLPNPSTAQPKNEKTNPIPPRPGMRATSDYPKLSHAAMREAAIRKAAASGMALRAALKAARRLPTA